MSRKLRYLVVIDVLHGKRRKFTEEAEDIEAIYFKYKYAGKIVSITEVGNEKD